MNNYFSSLLCIIVLAFAPACNKKKSSFAKASDFVKTSSDKSADRPRIEKEDVKTMIELDDSVFEIEEIEIEEDLNDQKAIKF